MKARQVVTALMVVAQKKAPASAPVSGASSCDPDRLPAGSSCHDWYLLGQCRRLTGRTEPFEMALLQDEADGRGQVRAFLAGFRGNPSLRSVCGP